MDGGALGLGAPNCWVGHRGGHRDGGSPSFHGWARAIPPDPDNAALLYYQAFLSLAELIKAMDLRLSEKIDEAVLAANREYYDRFMIRMQATLAVPMSYPEKWSALQAMFSQLTQDAKKGTEATLTAALVPALGKVHGIDVKAQARANALRVGLDLLTAKAQTGTLPDRLPANTLKDPFCVRDYLYERTSGGFVLRCQGKDLDKKPSLRMAV